MNCEQFKEMILALLYEDEIAGAERAELTRHLRTCPHCNDEFNELKLVRNELAQWKDPAVHSFPVTMPYPSAWLVLRQWLLPSLWNWRNALTFATVAGLLVLVTFSVLGTRIEISRKGLLFHTDLLRRTAPASPSRVDAARLSSTVSDRFPPVSQTQTTPDRHLTLQEVSRMIQDSESRQQQLIKAEEIRLTDQLAAGYRTQLTHLARTLDNKHRLDLATIYTDLEQQRLSDLQRIRVTFSSLDERASQQAQQTQTLVDLIQKASYTPK
jgi:hypothetical protein